MIDEPKETKPNISIIFISAEYVLPSSQIICIYVVKGISFIRKIRHLCYTSLQVIGSHTAKHITTFSLYKNQTPLFKTTK